MIHRTQLISLSLTVASESAGMFIYSFWSLHHRGNAERNLTAAFAVNLVSHTVFWHFFPVFAGAYLPSLAVAEGLVVLVEATAYRILLRFMPGEALAVSTALNLFSCALALIPIPFR